MIDKSSISKHYIESLKAAEKNDLLCAMRPEKRTLQELRMNALQCQSILSLKICQHPVILPHTCVHCLVCGIGGNYYDDGGDDGDDDDDDDGDDDDDDGDDDQVANDSYGS